MTELLVVGSGNISEHLINQLSGLNDISIHITGRNKQRVNALRTKFSLADIKPKHVDLVLICVSDHAILEVANEIAKEYPNALFIHTSGATSIEILKGTVNRYGLFYPLQTFSSGRSIEFNEIPILINSNSEKDLILIDSIASRISSKVIQVNEHDRMILHVAAVLVNNFANKLFDEAFQLLDTNHLDFELLKPLIKETINKLDSLTPHEAQTGPAIRGDLNSINQHIELIADDPALADLYRSITKMINPKLQL